MDAILIELMLWAGLLFFFWTLKDGRSNAGSEAESPRFPHDGSHRPRPGLRSTRFWRPQRVTEPIGSYRGEQIYRYAVIDGRHYQFDHVWPLDKGMALKANERCVAPGLVYLECCDQ